MVGIGSIGLAWPSGVTGAWLDPTLGEGVAGFGDSAGLSMSESWPLRLILGVFLALVLGGGEMGRSGRGWVDFVRSLITI